ncbi:Uncharacterized protein dnm_088170 [Desulfonema magnum]|uniref:Uncharacterized protein n=1 Tax=Desulfonema magnum TaxID=45655 RepID=A0A975GU20_9BACT|nr:Uncharacterized protein dnm_088170 [Desulfonema magnum]
MNRFRKIFAGLFLLTLEQLLKVIRLKSFRAICGTAKKPSFFFRARCLPGRKKPGFSPYASG